MRRSFSITFTFTVLLDDWLVIFYDSRGAEVAIWNTESWEQWGEYGVTEQSQLAPEYIEARKQAVIEHAIELYKNSYSHSTV